jgi:hypothetical protein
MKTKKSTLITLAIAASLTMYCFSNAAHAQVIEKTDSLKSPQADTIKVIPPDSLKAIQAAPMVAPAVAAEANKAEKSEPTKEKDKRGKKNEIVFYGGLNYTKLGTSNTYETEGHAGYQLGGYYKQGRLLYWQAGLRYANASMGYKESDSPAGTAFGTFTFSDLDIPLTLGLNFTQFMNRVLAVRLYISAVPSFTMSVGDNNYGITKDNVNSFVLYGQGGIGINVAFVVLEFGYNYGFNELLIDNTDSKPGQIFVNLGFRF